ncbi:uncharacterized protein LOC124363234 isoform X1 [Homalodisca vitripennis]|uniref:uncharacterized protein LOC124363234 isoform X1 n=1 Tax=Homalodisca vitripennis TaxID=197043 RepID=UPI001EECA642|nr:uncharacterized protein LOC124363234 isoform X1 [Homalodisca vitripennis]KAG8271284.1 hypothetical protein J6590_067260 [Homalodisca vitripennis]
MQYWMLTFVAMILVNQETKSKKVSKDPVEMKLENLGKELKKKHDPGYKRQCERVIRAIGPDVDIMAACLEKCRTTKDPEQKRECDRVSHRWPKVVDTYCEVFDKVCKRKE